MARNRRVKRDGNANYHLMSRTSNRQFFFAKGRLKTQIVHALRRSALFSGIRVHAFCLMDDHFHVVCRVVKPDAPIPESEVLRRIAMLKGRRAADEIAGHWAELRRIGASAAADEALGLWRRRMNDVSEFMKTFKELVNILYKRESPHCGSIWSGRFKSTLVEDGAYLATCVRYVELNPVRAGMVRHAKDYAWSSANGEKDAIDGVFAGTVPEEVERRLGRRVAQIGSGVVFGSRAFVSEVGWRMGHCFSGRPVARPVMGDAYAALGHRLAAKEGSAA